MLLQELSGVKRFHNLDEYQFLKMLRRLGVTMSNGRYGMVFSHPSWDYVYKIFDHDPQYMEFVNYCISHPSKHFPKIMKKPMTLHKFHRRAITYAKQEVWNVVKIEKLSEVTDKKLLAFIVENLESGYVAIWDNSSRTYSHPNHNTLMPDGEWKRGISIGDVFEAAPWFKSLCEDCAAFVKYTQDNNIDSGINDIHGGNFMQRKDGTIVFIDPAWAGYNPYTAAYEQHMEEIDGYAHEDEPPQQTGPSYLKKNQRVSPHEQRAIDREKRLNPRSMDNDTLGDDDIPF